MSDKKRNKRQLPQLFSHLEYTRDVSLSDRQRWVEEDKKAAAAGLATDRQWAMLLKEAGWQKCDQDGYYVAHRDGTLMTEKQFLRWREKGRVPSPEEVNAELSELVDMVCIERPDSPGYRMWVEFNEAMAMIAHELSEEFANADFGEDDEAISALNISVGRMTRREADLIPEWEGW